jgi:hypothetical protein
LITSGGDGPTYYLGTLTPFQPDPIGNPGVYTNFPAGAPEGQRVAIAFNFEGSGGQGEYGIYQTLADTLQSFTTYAVQVEIGNIASGTSMNGSFFPLSGFPGYRVDLLAGNTIIAQDNNSLAGSIDDGEFATSSFEFTAGDSHPLLDEQLRIRLVNLNVVDPAFPNSDLEVDFDNVRITATPVVPGDLNGDGWVDIFDVGLVSEHWEETGPAGIPGDANFDGEVDIFDVGTISDHWNPNLGGTGVPEPSAFVLLILGALGYLAYDRALRREAV